jgi:hypothetical protein
MFIRRSKEKLLFFCLFFLFAFPFCGKAFEVRPAVVDIVFPPDSPEVTQTISVKNIDDADKLYEASMRRVTFAPDGSIAALQEVNGQDEVSLSPSFFPLSSQAEGAFTVTFSSPGRISHDRVFGLLITEKDVLGQEISGAFVVLLFPEPSPDAVRHFRIDAFSVLPKEDGLEGIVQLSNLGETLVKPALVLVVTDKTGKEIDRFVFAEHEGRLPVGTSRVITDTLLLRDFGWWHPGGDLTFRLLATSGAGDEVQQAVVRLSSQVGMGYWILGALLFLLFGGGVVFLRKKQGILSA